MVARAGSNKRGTVGSWPDPIKVYSVSLLIYDEDTDTCKYHHNLPTVNHWNTWLSQAEFSSIKVKRG